MTKKILLLPILGLTATAVAQAEYSNNELYLFLGGASGTTSVSTSMHDNGSAAASYTLGSSGNSGVQTTTGSSSSGGGSGSSAAYEESKYDSSSSVSSSSSRRRASGGSGSSGTSSSHDTSSGLANGGIIAEANDPSPLIITADAGYQSQYVYNGINRIRLANAAKGTVAALNSSQKDFSMYYVGAGVKWKGLSAGLKYIRSFDSNLNPVFHPSAAKNSAYSEYVLDLNYTLGLISGPQGSGNWLDATVGYEFTYFPEDTFWNTDTQQKYYASLKVNRYKWVRPSVTFLTIDAGSSLNGASTWNAGFDILSGEQVVFQVDGGDVVLSTGNVDVGVGYYVKTGHASGYNKALDTELNGDWYQAGLNIPISFGDFTVTPSVHYTENDAKLVREPGFWWGINAKYTF